MDLTLLKIVLPVVPVAAYFCGGIAIDRAAQTSLQRFRAIGEVACTGLFWDHRDETLGVLESLTWALACADDLAKQATKVDLLLSGTEGRARPSRHIPLRFRRRLEALAPNHVVLYRDQSRTEHILKGDVPCSTNFIGKCFTRLSHAFD